LFWEALELLQLWGQQNLPGIDSWQGMALLLWRLKNDGRARPIGNLCIPRTRSGSNDDEVRLGLATQRSVAILGTADVPVNPCPRTNVFGARCNTCVSREDPAQVTLAQYDDVIEALSAD
jgi:hypothetical protein